MENKLNIKKEELKKLKNELLLTSNLTQAKELEFQNLETKVDIIINLLQEKENAYNLAQQKLIEADQNAKRIVTEKEIKMKTRSALDKIKEFILVKNIELIAKKFSDLFNKDQKALNKKDKFSIINKSSKIQKYITYLIGLVHAK